MRPLWQDLLLGFRTLRKEPASALIASLTLALGIGLCSTAFSLTYGVFLRGLDIPDPDRVTLVLRSNPARSEEWMGVTIHDYHDWREQQTSFSNLAGYYTGTVNLSGPEGPERFNGGFVSANLFEVLRVPAALGTTFRAGDDQAGAPLAVVLGHDLWTSRYGADPGIVGQPVIVNGEAATILGVMPDDFRFPQDQQLWVALRDSRATLAQRDQGNQLTVIGRLRDGVTADQASQEMALIAERLAQAWPASNEGITARLQSVVANDTGAELKAVFGAMQVATFFVLLIAIANVANLLMARATLRTREAAVRSALGASRFRIVLPFFAETLLLAGVGAAVGIAIAYVGVTLFDGATSDVGKPYYMIFALDLPVLAFVVGITVLTALLAGAAPAFQVLRTNVNATLKDEGRGTSGVLGGRLTRALVTAEIALSCALLIGAGLMVKSIVRLRNFEYPFATGAVFTARIGLFETEYPDATARQAFYRDLAQRLAAIPGARATALTTHLPLNADRRAIAIEGQGYQDEDDYPEASNVAASPGYFESFGVALLAGRDFALTDEAASQPVAIVNQSFARQFFAGQDPVGRRFAEREGRDRQGEWRTIIGVVPDLRMEGFDPDRPPSWGYYVPLAQRDPRFVSLVLHSAGGDPLALAAPVREAIRTLDPNLPIYNVDTMAGVVRQASWFYQVFGTLFIAFGAAALFMATVGLYGVLSFSVSRRLREMGIRMALGASPRDVVRLVMRQGAVQIGLGLAGGLLMAFGLTRVIAFLLFEMTPQDPPVFALVTVTITLVGMMASLVPARRATLTQPTEALRAE